MIDLWLTKINMIVIIDVCPCKKTLSAQSNVEKRGRPVIYEIYEIKESECCNEMEFRMLNFFFEKREKKKKKKKVQKRKSRIQIEFYRWIGSKSPCVKQDPPWGIGP